MLIPHDKLIGLPAETRSGRRLGRVHGFVVETDGQGIRQYAVRTVGMANLFAKDLLISREQVVSLSEKKLIVDDNAAPGAEQSAIAASG